FACGTSTQDRHLPSPNATRVLRSIVSFASAHLGHLAKPNQQTFVLRSLNSLERRRDLRGRSPSRVRQKSIRTPAIIRSCFAHLFADEEKSGPGRRPSHGALQGSRSLSPLRQRRNHMPT